MKFRLSFVLVVFVLLFYSAARSQSGGADSDDDAAKAVRKKIVRRVLIPGSGERRTIPSADSGGGGSNRRAHLVRVRTQRVPLARDDSSKVVSPLKRKSKVALSRKAVPAVPIDHHLDEEGEPDDLDDSVATAAESPPTVTKGESEANGKASKRTPAAKTSVSFQQRYNWSK